MTQKLIIHIGGSKCGSSAIQRFFDKNAGDLKKQNLLIPSVNLLPDERVTGDQIWYFQNLIKDGQTGIDRFQNRLKALAEKNPKDTIVLSAENLSNPHGFEDVFAGLDAQFDLQVLCYIRRQDDYLMSAWQQWFMKSNPDFWSWALGQVGERANWQKALEPWIKTFGKDRVTVRLFDRAKLVDGDVIMDFCEFAGIDGSELDRDLGKINPSYNNAVQDIVESANFLFKDIHDNSVFEMIGSLTGPRHYKRSGEVFLNRSQRVAIIKRYHDSNEWVRENFFPEEEEGALFSLPKAQQFNNPHRTLEQEKDALLFDLIYQLYRKIDKPTDSGV